MQGGNLHAVFNKVTFNKPEMGSSQFAKVIKQNKKYKFSDADIDNTFAKAKMKGATKISFAEFQKALHMLADIKKVDHAQFEADIAGQGVEFKGTKADYVKFHDDKSQYTGVYARGGPTTVDAGRGGMVSDISQTCDRSAADVRGVKK